MLVLYLCLQIHVSSAKIHKILQGRHSIGDSNTALYNAMPTTIM